MEGPLTAPTKHLVTWDDLIEAVVDDVVVETLALREGCDVHFPVEAVLDGYRTLWREDCSKHPDRGV